MKIGIKCEIHDCTISICQLLENTGILPKGYTSILEKDKQLRIDNQYYLKNKDVPVDYDQLVEFVLTIKNINLTNDQLIKIRKKLFP